LKDKIKFTEDFLPVVAKGAQKYETYLDSDSSIGDFYMKSRFS
jgi:hypothetical protein